MIDQDRRQSEQQRPEAERRQHQHVLQLLGAREFPGLNGHCFPHLFVGRDFNTFRYLKLPPLHEAISKDRGHRALTKDAFFQAVVRRSISRSSRAASSALTSVIGSLNSTLSINPVRHSQYLIGAGLGSENSNRTSSSTDRQRASAALLSPASCSFQTLANISVSTCADARMPPSAPSTSAS